MSTFKPFYIRICTQCKDPQPLKCAKCVHHPKRTPKVIEVYAPPMTTKICECRLSFQFECQRDGCGKRVWRSKTSNSRAGMVYAKKLFCSVECRMIQLGKDITTRVEVPCDWCGKKVLRTPCRLKRENIFCCKSHIYLWREKKRHDIREEEKKSAIEYARESDDPTTGLLECSTCKKDTIHDTPRQFPGTFKFPKAKCQECGTQRSQDLGATMLNRDAMAITMLSKAV